MPIILCNSEHTVIWIEQVWNLEFFSFICNTSIWFHLFFVWNRYFNGILYLCDGIGSTFVKKWYSSLHLLKSKTITIVRFLSNFKKKDDWTKNNISIQLVLLNAKTTVRSEVLIPTKSSTFLKKVNNETHTS